MLWDHKMKELLSSCFVGLPLQAKETTNWKEYHKPHGHGISAQAGGAVERGETVELPSDNLRTRGRCEPESWDQCEMILG